MIGTLSVCVSSLNIVFLDDKGLLLYPRMLKNHVDVNPLIHRPGETPRDQIFTVRRNLPAEQEVTTTDLEVFLPGDVATHHVVEEDSQGPHSGRASLVSPTEDPLWRGVHTGPVKVSVGLPLLL